MFEGFDLGGVEYVEVESYTVGPGGHAELIDVTLAVYRSGAEEPEFMEIAFEGAGMSALTLQQLVRVLNERLSLRRRADPSGEGG